MSVEAECTLVVQRFNLVSPSGDGVSTQIRSVASSECMHLLFYGIPPTFQEPTIYIQVKPNDPKEDMGWWTPSKVLLDALKRFPDIPWIDYSDILLAELPLRSYEAIAPELEQLFGRIEYVFQSQWRFPDRITTFQHVFGCERGKISRTSACEVAWDTERYETLSPWLRRRIPASGTLTGFAAASLAAQQPFPDFVLPLLPLELRDLVVPPRMRSDSC